MSESRLSRFESWIILVTFCFVAGCAISSPLKLLDYFYPKPHVDFVITGVLFLSSTYLNYLWVRRFEGYRYLLLIVPVLGFIWLRLEYALYAESSVFNIISYGLVIVLGLGVSSVLEVIRQLKLGKSLVKWSVVTFVFLLGLTCGFLFSLNSLWAWLCALFLFVVYAELMKRDFLHLTVSLGSLALGVWVSVLLPKPEFFESQKSFEDKVVYSKTTRFQRIDVTEWKGNHWFYQDGINQFSSIDSWLYFEPFAHPVMQVIPKYSSVLVVGGENGMLARELRKYSGITVDLIPMDEEFLDISAQQSLFVDQHEGIFDWTSLKVLKEEPFYALQSRAGAYDLIMIDVPDPIDIELNQYFTREFYEECNLALKPEGYLVTQSGSPYFATAAFHSIQKSMQAAGFYTTSYHNQVLTLGEWAWTLGSKKDQGLPDRLRNLTFEKVETDWLNQEAMQMMLSFGKPYVNATVVKVNTMKDPVIYRYYNQGNYQLN